MLDYLIFVGLVFWWGLPLVTWTGNLAKQRRWNAFFLYIATVALSYVLLLMITWMADVAIKVEMDRFDLDGDGGIGGAELTPQAQRAVNRWANDTGRAMVVITGGPISAIWVGLVFTILYGAEWIVRKLFGQRPGALSNEAFDVDEANKDNPYRPPKTRSN